MQRVIYLRRPLQRRDQRGLQQQLERAFQSQWGQPSSLIMITHKEVWRPPADVYETASVFVVRVELAGMREAQISVILDDRGVRIEGVRPQQHGERPLSYHQMGINYGAFTVEVFLNSPFDYEHVNARYEDGFLYVELPKLAENPITHVTLQVTE
jgi:HSP20 family molecular chaperone IbpA